MKSTHQQNIMDAHNTNGHIANGNGHSTSNGSAATSNGYHHKSSHAETSESASVSKADSVRRRRSPRLVNGSGNKNDNMTSSRKQVKNGTYNADRAQLVSAGDDTAAEPEVALDVPTRTEVLKDLANLCTLVGAILATVAIACMWTGRYYAGMCLNVAANIADIIDGPIARSTANRHPALSVIGCKLDCYSDMVSHFVVPASLLMHISDIDVACTLLAAFYICAGILRQSYFEVTGRCAGGTCIYGLTSDYMVAIYSVAMHLSPIVGQSQMPYVLAFCVVLMIYCSLTFSLRSRRYDGFGLATVTAYNVFLCISCLVLHVLSTNAAEIDSWVYTLLFLGNLLLAYPCYFRFVELNR